MSATMMEAHLPHPEGSLLARAEAWLGYVVEVPAAALVAGEVVVLLAGVISRFIFNSPIPWAERTGTSGRNGMPSHMISWANSMPPM